MAAPRPDRRVRRTRRRLKEALLALVRERGYGGITIRELTERADVGRSTFYSHFGSKEDLLFDQFDAWVLSLADARVPEAPGSCSEGRFRFSLPLLRHVAAEPRLFQAVMGSRAGGRVRRRATELVTEVALRELSRREPVATGDVPRRRAALAGRAHAVAGAFLGVAAWWMDAARDLPPETVDEIFHSAIR